MATIATGTCCLLFLIGLSAVKAENGPVLHERCVVGGDAALASRNSKTQEGATIYHQMAFKCDGRIMSWEVHAEKRGVVRVDLWRKTTQGGETKAQLMGSNRLDIPSKGKHTFEIPFQRRLNVLPDDIIGIHGAKNVLSQESNQEAGQTLDSNLLSHVTLVDDWPMEIGDVIDDVELEEHLKLLPAIKAIVKGPNPNLRLHGGFEADGRDGLAQMLQNGKWRPICDKWMDVDGWPRVMCRDLGFPDAVEANYTHVYINMTGNRKLRGRGRHALRNPNCKWSEVKDMMLCKGHAKARKCSHKTDDVYIKCAPKVRMYKARKRNGRRNQKLYGGLPQMYVEGQWGTICDQTDVGSLNSDKMHNWPNGICVQMGFSGVKRVKTSRWADKFPIVMHTPTCKKTSKTFLGECIPGPYSDNCYKKKNIYKIICIDTQTEEHEIYIKED